MSLGHPQAQGCCWHVGPRLRDEHPGAVSSPRPRGPSSPLPLLRPSEPGLVPCVGLPPRGVSGRQRAAGRSGPGRAHPPPTHRASRRGTDALSSESRASGRCPGPREGARSPERPCPAQPPCVSRTCRCFSVEGGQCPEGRARGPAHSTDSGGASIFRKDGAGGTEPLERAFHPQMSARRTVSEE